MRNDSGGMSVPEGGTGCPSAGPGQADGVTGARRRVCRSWACCTRAPGAAVVQVETWGFRFVSFVRTHRRKISELSDVSSPVT